MKIKYANKAADEMSSCEIQTGQKSSEENSLTQSLLTLVRSKTLILRFMNCCYQWMAGCFGYFVLSLASTNIPGENRYISFIFVMAIEIPGNLLSQLLLSRMNRRRMLPMMLGMAACSIIISPFIPKEHANIVLLLFMLSKASMTCAYSAMFVFTAELWPTNIRTTIMNTCLCMGRIGAMLAPLTLVMVSEIFNTCDNIFN